MKCASDRRSCCRAQGKRHQQNLAKRAAWEAQDKPSVPAPQRRTAVTKTVKIGRPGYRVTKQFDSSTAQQRSLLFQVRTITRVLFLPDALDVVCITNAILLSEAVIINNTFKWGGNLANAEHSSVVSASSSPFPPHSLLAVAESVASSALPACTDVFYASGALHN